MQPTKQRLLAVVDHIIENIENYIMSVGLLAISAIVFSNVIARYFFATSFSWSEELSRYIIVWITFVGVSSCARHDAHVKVDVLPGMLKGNARRVHEIAINLVMMGLCAYMTYVSFGFMMVQFRGGNTSVSIALPIWTIYLSTVLGFLFSTFAYGRRIYLGLRKEDQQALADVPSTESGEGAE